MLPLTTGDKLTGIDELCPRLESAQTDAASAAQALKDVSRSAELDALTELPNRALLLDRFAQARANARRRHTRMAVLFLRFDNSKQSSDALGRGARAQVLKGAAQCLASSIREADTVNLHGADKFVVLLTDLSQASDALAVADKMIEALGAPGRVGDRELCLAASIGISVYPDDGEDADELIERAEAAACRAKEHGLGPAFFNEDEARLPRRPERTTLELPPTPSTRQGLGLTEHELDQMQLKEAREANTQLLLAALSAQELQSAAEQARLRLTELMAVVAHELRNPLAPIRTAAALLGRVGPQELPRLQAVIERQVLRVLALVGDLLDVSRVSTGKLRLERQMVDMAGVIAEAVDACRPAVTVRAQHLEIDVPDCAFEVNGDPARLVQIVSNLLDNASKYTPDGGDIGLSVELVNHQTMMTVSDNGIGITADALPQIFEPFVQDKHAIGFNAVGLGIGLAVVRELVKAHGGTVDVRSAGIGCGSQFVVALPLAGHESLHDIAPSPH